MKHYIIKLIILIILILIASIAIAVRVPCQVKANISSNGMIYHTPESPFYTVTKIDPNKCTTLNGKTVCEAVLCSEKEAKLLGFKKVYDN